VALIFSSIASRCSSTPRISGSANRRVSASSVVGGGSSNFSPQCDAPFSSSIAAAAGNPELRQLEFEIFRRVQVVLKQKLHCAFARFASFAHNQSLKPKAQSLSLSCNHPHSLSHLIVNSLRMRMTTRMRRIKILRMKVGKLLHTRYRVNDLERTVKFYRDVLGLAEVRRHKSPRGSELVFMQADGSEELIELCHFPAANP